MKIKALKALVGNYGRLNCGNIIELPEWQASQLLARGYVVPVVETENDRYKNTKTSRGKLHRGGSDKHKAGT